MSPETQVVGQPLTLECNVTAVRGITSRVDIVWSSDGIEPQRTTGAVMHITNVNSVIYQDLYTISPLSTNDDGTTVKCDVMINVTPLVTATGNVTLFVRGKISRHTVVYRVAKKAGAPYHEYIYRKEQNTIFTHT